MDCEKASEMKPLDALVDLGKPMKQLKTVCLRHKTTLFAIHRDHFPDLKQRTLYGWSKNPETIPPLIFQRIAKALKMTTDELITEIWGEK